MRKTEIKIKAGARIIIILAVLAIFLVPVLAMAGNLGSSTAPGVTMETSHEPYDGASGGVNEREGFLKQLTCTPVGDEIITVPNGKRLVILQILTRDPTKWWRLKITSGSSDEQFLDNNIFGYRSVSDSSGTSEIGSFNVTFPDRCITVKQNQTLSLIGDRTGSVTIIGYLYNNKP